MKNEEINEENYESLKKYSFLKTVTGVINYAVFSVVLFGLFCCFTFSLLCTILAMLGGMIAADKLTNLEDKLIRMKIFLDKDYVIKKGLNLSDLKTNLKKFEKEKENSSNSEIKQNEIVDSCIDESTKKLSNQELKDKLLKERDFLLSFNNDTKEKPLEKKLGERK